MRNYIFCANFFMHNNSLDYMLESKVILNPSSSTTSIKALFPVDPKGDLFIKMADSNYQLSKSVLKTQSEFFNDAVQSSLLKIEIDEKIDPPAFYNVMSALCGNKIEVAKQQIPKYYEIIKFLRIPQFQAKISQQILKNAHHYDIFCLISAAQKYSDQKIFEFCFQRFQKQNYEHLLYNKSSFLQIDLPLFKLIVKAHNQHKSIHRKGLNFTQISEILKEYCQVNHLSEGMLTQLKFELINVSLLTAQEYKEIFLMTSDQDNASNNLQDSPRSTADVSEYNTQSCHSFNNKIPNLMMKPSIKGSRLIVSLTQKDIKNQMQITYYKKKVNQLIKSNTKLHQELEKLKKITKENQQSHLSLCAQVESLKATLQKKKQIQEQNLLTIKKFEDMLHKLQSELDERAQEINKYVEEKKLLKQSYFNVNQKPANIQDSFIVKSQFLPANLIHEMFSSKSSSISKSKNTIPVPKKQKNRIQESVCEQKVEKPFESQSSIKLQFDQGPYSLSTQQQNILSKFIPSSGFYKVKQLQLLYRRSQNHRQFGKKQSIRNKNPLLFLIQTKSGEKIGGYISVRIPNSKVAYLEDREAFLFNLNKKKKLPIKSSDVKQAIMLSQSYLVSFSNDLLVANDCLNENSYCFWHCSYGVEDFAKGKGPAWFAGSSQFKIEILEIYEVKDGEIQMIL